MTLELHNGLNQPQVLECKRIVCKDGFNNPICVVVETAANCFWIKHAGEPDFNEALVAMGIKDTVVAKIYNKDSTGLILPD